MIYLAAAPDDLSFPHPDFPHIAHAAIHLDAESRMHRSPFPSPAPNDLLLFTADNLCSFSCPEALAQTIAKEAAAHNFSGVAADLAPSPTPGKLRFLSLLDRTLCASSLQLFVPEEFGSVCPHALAVLCTAMSGGIYSKRLKDAASHFGIHRLALDVQRLIMRFSLPAPTGTGAVLSPRQFKEVTGRLCPTVFFSRELCSKYFLFRQQGRLQLMLFDDAATLREKIRLGKELGITRFFLSYPDISDLL